jgi:tRNA threonylcarbamoyladenosine biosynthesis protein TsaB
MAYILNIETATKNCSVSLAKNGKVLQIKEIAGQGYSHAEKLHVFIEEILRESELDFLDLSAIAVSQGPGSYTGLRIGVSTAKGLCYALNIPLIAVDTMQILASGAGIKDGIIIPMIDARRMEVYSAIFNANGQKIRKTQAEIIDASSFGEFFGKIFLVGDCAEKCKSVLTNANFTFLEEIVYPSSKEMGILSFDKYKISDTVDVAYFEPYYLKDFFLTKRLR